MIRIGYCANDSIHSVGLPLAADPAFHPKRDTHSLGGPASACPSLNDYSRSSFAVGLAYDLRFCVRQSNNGEFFLEFDRSITSLPESSLNRAIDLSNIGAGIVQLALHPFWMFISDTKDVQMVILPAIGQTNPEPIRGQFNIYDWFRHTSYAFRVEPNTWVTLSRNSPIFSVKFFHPTETHFALQEIDKTPQIRRHERNMELHSIIGHQTFAKWREIFLFNRHRRPATVLNFITEEQHG